MPSEEIATILREHKGVTIQLDDAGADTLLVKPFSMDDLLDVQVVSDLAEIGKVAMGSIDKLETIMDNLDADNVVPKIDALLDLFKSVMVPVRRCLTRCLSRPLSDVPGWKVPEVLKVFFVQNFSGPRLKPWADLLPQAGAMLKKAGKNVTSATPGNFSSSTAIPPTGSPLTPETNSNSGSGDASAGKPASAQTP